MNEIDVTTPDKPDLQQFTPEQIDEYCESMQRCYRKGQGKPVGVQIIRQLQQTGVKRKRRQAARELRADCDRMSKQGHDSLVGYF